MSETSRKRNVKWLWTILRIIIGIALIAFLLWKCNISSIMQHVRAMDIRYLAYALIPYLAFIIVSAWRWYVLLEYKKMRFSFPRAVSVYFISVFFSNIFPTTIGGDVMRVLYADPGRKTESLAVVIADRILGFVGLFIFSLLCVMYLMVFYHRIEYLSFAIGGLALLILITYFLFSERIYTFFSPLITKIKIFKFGERLNNLHRIMTGFGGAWGLIGLCILQSIIIQALLALAPYVVMKGMGFKLGVLPFFLYIPIINIISMIPVSLNALGVRENAYVFFFSRAGLEGATSFTMSIVSFFVYFILTLAGGVVFVLYRRKKNEVKL